ncbi:MAG: 4-hydroxy-tetrahydrodipicolinate synthase [Clostridia bacterium]|nr:4-hydroxy-tetrahydrodipicolinate synthase [Clostridia bacterium]
MIFTGSAVALATPFTDDGINFATLERLLEFQIEGGTDAILVLGTTGEPATMSPEEKDELLRFVFRRVDGRTPLIVGVGGNNTRAAAESAARARDMGAAAVLAVTPYYNKCSQDGLIRHFTTIADAGRLPVIVYNVPGRTAVNISAAQFSELLLHPHIEAIKEASGDISQVADMAHAAQGRGAVYSGNDDQIVPVLSLGGSGVISVAANLMPGYVHDMVDSYQNGSHETARRMQLELNPLVRALFSEVNPIPVKTALSLMGFDMGDVRLPLTPLAEDKTRELQKEMEVFGLLDQF